MSRCRLIWLRDSAGRGCSRRPLAALGQKTLRFERDCLMTALVSAPAQPVRRVATCIAAVAAITLGPSLALAQQPAPTQPVPAPKATPRPVQPAQKAPAKQPQQPAQQARSEEET